MLNKQGTISGKSALYRSEYMYVKDDANRMNILSLYQICISFAVCLCLCFSGWCLCVCVGVCFGYTVTRKEEEKINIIRENFLDYISLRKILF